MVMFDTITFKLCFFELWSTIQLGSAEHIRNEADLCIKRTHRPPHSGLFGRPCEMHINWAGTGEGCLRKDGDASMRHYVI